MNGRVIMYADTESDAMKSAIKETKRRREIQDRYNKEHNITPKSIKKAVENILEREKDEKLDAEKQELEVRKSNYNLLNPAQRKKYMKEIEKEMKAAADELDFERAAVLRDEWLSLNQ